MPEAKRLRSSGTAKSKPPLKVKTPAEDERPTPAEIEEAEHPFIGVARKHWLKPTKRTGRTKVKNEVLRKEIWDPLEAEGFQYKSLQLLESLQILESYLWPGYTDEATNYHVLLVAFIVNVKDREHLATWKIFEDRPSEFTSFFRRILSLMLDRTISFTIRTHLLGFLIHAFQSLDMSNVRKECAPLVSISIWHNLSTEIFRNEQIEQAAHVKRAWRAALKRFDAADDAGKARLRFERSWLFSLLQDYLGVLFENDATQDQTLYCERFTEFLSDLLSTLPLRRYVNTMIRDLNLIPIAKQSPLYHHEENSLIRDLLALLSHYANFSIDDQTGVQRTSTEAYDAHCASLGRLQRVALKHFKDKLTVLALSNYGALNKREELQSLLKPLSDEELSELMVHLHLRDQYPDGLKISVDRQLRMEIVLWHFEEKKTFQQVTESMSIVPTEQTLFDRGSQRANSYDGSRPLALPKLNIQYLSVGDFLWRAFVLYRCESFYGIRKDVEAALRRLKPEKSRSGGTHLSGFSRLAIPIAKPSILEIVPALVGSHHPSLVRAEISFDVRKLGEGLKEWDSLRPDDVVFLLAIEPPPLKEELSNGSAAHSEAQNLGVIHIRTAEIIKITDNKGHQVRETAGGLDNVRRVQLKLDPETFAKDAEQAAAGKADPLERINLVLRRNRRENNFKPVLDSIRSLILSDAPLPRWLHETFLGYGDPAGSNHRRLGNTIKKLDYRDTFLDWQHLVESMPGKIVEPGDDASGSFGPPYVIETVDKPVEEVTEKRSKKRRRDVEPSLESGIKSLHVSSYEPPNQGPYPADVPRTNSVRFTPAQIEAIMSGSQPGLTVVVGPPGTGKTDVATQIISNLYHSFPEQKTLLLAHSNQALNQLFTKIAALDIDERHLLRLGHGEEELAMKGSFSKHGRVESFLQNRDQYLVEVRKLAGSLDAPGAHDNSAETAGYFNMVYVEPAWKKFLQLASSDGSSAAQIAQAFPFHVYFSDAPQPLFPQDASREQVLDVANGCYRHISKIFSELADILPFEILRRERDKANYLLTNEARIIAMTTTHAAMKRGEIASLGFRYDNVVMEEAAQITEIESFLPLAMQKPAQGEMPLARVVLCGDHFQNSPVIQSLAFKHYSNLEQSLFSRLVRLNVPVITLDQQGRARPSIAQLYQWRYPGLSNLATIDDRQEFQRANSGFKYDYQFINVPPYKGRGEQEPTPHFIQNLGEAEYAVAIYQYMRLLGYPADKVTILTTYAGQRALIRDVLSYRCAKNPIFGVPKAVATVDKYQGEQNDYIILSLTRTSRVGYLRDIRRMTVAVSRARLGLYILGRREVFEACPELRPTFDVLLQRPDKLVLATGEMWPSQRSLPKADEAVPGEAVMEGLEHLGAFVFEMTNTKVRHMQADGMQSRGEEEGQEEDQEEDQEGEKQEEEEDQESGNENLEQEKEAKAI